MHSSEPIYELVKFSLKNAAACAEFPLLRGRLAKSAPLTWFKSVLKTKSDLNKE